MVRMLDGSLGRTMMRRGVRHFVTSGGRKTLTWDVILCTGTTFRETEVDDNEGALTPTCVRCWSAILTGKVR